MMKRMKKSPIITSLFFLAVAAVIGVKACHFPVLHWPLEPTNVEHEIGNSGGEFQQYTGLPYFHEGVDILDDEPGPTGPFVRTTRAGDVSLSISTSPLYHGLTVSHGDADNSQYKYWHLDFNSIQQAVRDADTDGTQLPANSRVAQLANWTACSYHHVHYETCDNDGCEDPIWSFTPRNDTSGPSLTGVFFTEDGTVTQFPPGFPATDIDGKVDIVVRGFDRQFGTARTGILRLRYRVYNESGTIKSGPLIDFTDIPADSKATVLYRNTAPFDSDSNYCGTEQYFYVVTNVDDADASNFQEIFSWDTTTVPNGRYNVEVQAWDASGNTMSLTKFVDVVN